MSEFRTGWMMGFAAATFYFGMLMLFQPHEVVIPTMVVFGAAFGGVGLWRLMTTVRSDAE